MKIKKVKIHMIGLIILNMFNVILAFYLGSVVIVVAVVNLIILTFFAFVVVAKELYDRKIGQ